MRAKKLDSKGFPLGPVHLNETTWYYLEDSGVSLVKEVRNKSDGQYLCTEIVNLSWRRLQGMLKVLNNRKNKKR